MNQFRTISQDALGPQIQMFNVPDRLTPIYGNGYIIIMCLCLPAKPKTVSNPYIIGTYDDEYIYNAYETVIGCYKHGFIHTCKKYEKGGALAKYGNGEIMSFKDQVLAEYQGDNSGGAACAMVYLFDDAWKDVEKASNINRFNG